MAQWLADCFSARDISFLWLRACDDRAGLDSPDRDVRDHCSAALLSNVDKESSRTQGKNISSAGNQSSRDPLPPRPSSKGRGGERNLWLFGTRH